MYIVYYILYTAGGTSNFFSCIFLFLLYIIKFNNNEIWYLMMKIQKSSVKSVENAFTALEFIVEMTLEREGATLGEIAEKLGMRKTTARNLLQTMELCGYVTRRGFGFYRLGNQFGRLLMVSETVNRLRSISMPLQECCARPLEYFLQRQTPHFAVS